MKPASPRRELPAYGHVLHGALKGDPTLSICADEAEESSRIVEPILDAWVQSLGPLLEYPADSEGPSGVEIRP